MDYEKAYKEALERAKKRFDANPTDGYVGYGNEILKEIFPELKESDDEKIREALIMYFGDMQEDEPLGRGITNRDALVYLEKQKEQKPAEWSEEEHKRIERIIDVLDWAEEKGRISYSDFIDYSIILSALRPQPHWKPSEEQMEALKALNCHGALSYVGQQGHLISLYNDIREL